MRLSIALLAMATGLPAAYGHTLQEAQTALNRTTYLGAGHYDTAYGMAEAPDGTIYVTGLTDSPNFPTTPGVVQPAYGGGTEDMFVAHFSADLSSLLDATFIGGSDDDRGYAIVYDSRNSLVYVAGATYSSDFPKTAKGAQPVYGGGGDTVLVVLTPDLHRMRATYLGGSGDDTPNTEDRGVGRTIALAVSPSNGHIYVSGPTASTDFPDTAGGAQPANAGDWDTYVATLSPGLRTLLQATYLGGFASDQPFGMALTPGGDVYVAGTTGSSDFPGTSQSAQPDLAGLDDAFVARLSPNLTHLLGASYFGGTSNDSGSAIAVASDVDTLYLAGTTASTDLQHTRYGAQPAYGGGNYDAFVAAFDLSLRHVWTATYLGGSGTDRARPALALSPADGSIYLAGTTTSLDFPDTANGIQSSYPGGNYASFVTHLSANLGRIEQSTYLGGSTSHTGLHALLIDALSLQVYAAGGSGAADLPNTTGAYDPKFAGGGHDAIASMLDPTLTGG